MDIKSLLVFSEVMKLKSFSSVARRRRVSTSSISRVISNLESELDIRLFHRNTRYLVPSESGEIYYRNVIDILQQLENSKLEATDVTNKVTGDLRLAMSVEFGNKIIVPLLTEFCAKYPNLSLDIKLSDEYVNLLEERIDIAIRIGTLMDSAYIAKHLMHMSFIICASPAYLETHEVIVKPKDTLNHTCLLLPTDGHYLNWIFRDNKAEDIVIPVSGNYQFNNINSLRICVKSGMGITLLPNWLIKEDLKDGSLVNIFPEYSVSATDFTEAVWLVYQSRSYLPKKIRVLVDFIYAKLNGD